MNYGIDCPDCGGPIKVRSSRPVTPTVRSFNLDCPNPDCVGSYGADLAITHVIRASLKPHPANHLRVAPLRQRPVMQPAANDGATVVVPTPANDEGSNIMTGTG